MSIVLLNRELPRQLADSYCQTASEENAQPHNSMSFDDEKPVSGMRRLSQMRGPDGTSL
jgi:hypothetical protein